jgi:hypothetical protein
LCVHNICASIYARTKPAKAFLPSQASRTKKVTHKSHVQNLQKLIVGPFYHLSPVQRDSDTTSKSILTRVGFEPTPFRTSVLEEP